MIHQKYHWLDKFNNFKLLACGRYVLSASIHLTLGNINIEIVVLWVLFNSARSTLCYMEKVSK